MSGELSAAGLLPDLAGHFGRYGGRFMPEALVPALDELDAVYRHAQADEAFQAEFHRLLRDYAGTPSMLYDATRLSETAGARILLKREDLNHTGAHKVRNVLGQALLTVRMGKKRVIAETGAGQHGVAAATACALFGLDCVVYMGEEDTRRQALNVARMKMLGAEVIPVRSGSRTLKDAMNEALRDWVTNVESTHYMIGTAAGPHPFPAMVRDFARGIGVEARAQCLALAGRPPDAACARVGGGPNPIGLFPPFTPAASGPPCGFAAGGAARGARRAPAFEKAKADGGGVLVGCMPAGFPTVPGSIAAMGAMVESGVDVVEVEFPYSDPVMDGPVIQRASEIALAGGVRTRDVLHAIEAAAQAGAPVILMTYWNPIERYGVDRFARDLASAGGAGLITPDLIPDEADEWPGPAPAYRPDHVFLAAPASSHEPLRKTVAHSRGLMYAANIIGVTGTRA